MIKKELKLFKNHANIKDDDIEKYLTDNYIDVKLFGAVITKPKRDILGPLQVAWSKSVHEAQIKFMQGNAAYASSEGKSQASIWTKYISPYALFKTYAVYNNLVAKKQNINVEDTIFETMSRSGIWYSTNISIKNSALQAPKLFRRANHIVLDNVHFSNAEETMWTCDDIRITNSQINGDYFGKK